MEDKPTNIADGHAPQPGPGYWDWRCLVCDGDVDKHPGVLERFRIRRRARA